MFISYDQEQQLLQTIPNVYEVSQAIQKTANNNICLISPNKHPERLFQNRSWKGGFIPKLIGKLYTMVFSRTLCNVAVTD